MGRVRLRVHMGRGSAGIDERFALRHGYDVTQNLRAPPEESLSLVLATLQQ